MGENNSESHCFEKFNVVHFQIFLWVFNLGVVIWHPLNSDLGIYDTICLFEERERETERETERDNYNGDTFKWQNIPPTL